VPVTPSRYLDDAEQRPYHSAVQATETSFLAELERVVRGERTTVDPRALLFVAAQVILEGRKADEHDLERQVKRALHGRQAEMSRVVPKR
jgi:hypothetical protein